FSMQEPQYQIKSNKWGRIKVVLIPFTDSHGRPYLFGAGMNLSEVDKLLTQSLRESLFLSLGFLGIGCVFSYIFAKVLSKPFNDLILEITDIASGRLDKKIEEKGCYEQLVLARSFNRMSQAIHEKIAALTKSEERFQLATEAAHIGCFDWLPQEGTVHWDTQMHRMFDLSLQATIDRSEYFFSVMHLDDKERLIAGFAKSMDPKNKDTLLKSEFKVQLKNGQVKHIEIQCLRFKDEKGVVSRIIGTCLDITERKQAEDLLQVLHDLSLKLSLTVGLDETLRLCVEAALQNTALDAGGIYFADELTGDLNLIYSKGLSPDFVSTILHYSADAPNTRLIMEGQTIYIDYPKLAVPKDEIRRSEGLRAIAIIPVQYKSITIACFNIASHFQDNVSTIDRTILETIAAQIGTFIVRAQEEERRKQAEEELRNLRNYLSNIIDSMPSMLVGVDLEGTITQWNAEAQRVTGVPVEDAMGQPLTQAFPRLAAEMERVSEAMHTREVRSDLRQVRKEDGEIRYEDVTVYPLIANGVEGAVIRVDDVTERVRIEEMIIQSEKMLSIGGLAAGMAHEINNPLAGMMQTADVVSRRLTDMELPVNQRAAEAAGTSMEAIRAFMEARKIIDMLERIRKSGHLAAEIVQNMLSFVRKSDSTFPSHNLVELLNQTVNLAGSDYGLKKRYDFRRIEIVREYEQDLPDVPCESGKIQQVLLNILRNGAYAMQSEAERDERGGMKGERKIPRFILRLAHEKEAGRVRIEIENNGPNMDEVTRKRVFEPFFTTKPVGVGTGLGLSVSYFIITENHGGEMSVESPPGEGTTFIIKLPIERKNEYVR
ncbi:MAG: PAS domain S-box protein, partial [bacterium]|nr:PAS domain S-box protein [bacterium]